MKNYRNPGGLSAALFLTQFENEYLVTGPMGIGLDPQNNGIHVAFAAGTGVLTFMDFVAHIAIRVLSKHKGTTVNHSEDLSSKFQFVLHVSFYNEQQAIGLPLLQSLDQFCAKHGYDDFKLYLRFSY